jgi:IS30 family transposase
MAATTDPPLERVAQRRRAVALARHYREAEGLSIARIAERLGRAPATVKGYLYDPTDANKGLSRERRPRREVARSGVTCQPRQHEGRSISGGPCFAVDWAVQPIR